MTIQERFLKKVNKIKDGCWNWKASKDKDGYGFFYHNNMKGGKAHRFSYEFYNGKIEKGKYVLHTCDNRSCVNPKHLYLGTALDNTQDRRVREQFVTVRGEKSHFAKLTERDVKEIRQTYKKGFNLTDIGRSFLTTPQNIYLIVNRKNWKHVK
jgi:hypothetical protein